MEREKEIQELKNKRREKLENKLNEFLNDENITISDLNIEYVEKFILTKLRIKYSRVTFYEYIQILREILEGNKISIKIDSMKYVDECVNMEGIEEHRKKILEILNKHE